MLLRRIVSLTSVLFLALFFATIGCSGRQKSGETQERLDRTIRDLEQHNKEHAALPYLRQSTPETLKTPRLIYVKVFEQPKSVRLCIEWIETKPTPDAVLIHNRDTGFKMSITFDQLYIDENVEASKTGVLFRYVQAYEPESEQWHDIRKQIFGGNTETFLTNNGKSVSNSVLVQWWREGAHSTKTEERQEEIKSLISKITKPGTDKDTWCSRTQAAENLGDIGVEAIPALMEVFKDKDKNVRRAAAYAMALIGKPAVPSLMEALKDDDVRVRENAGHALAGMGSEGLRAVPALIQAMKDKDGNVRAIAAYALGTIGPDAKAAVPALIEATKKDNDPHVRKNAAQALEKIR